MTSLFDSANLSAEAPRPLADRLRPDNLEDVLGQGHLLGEGAPLNRMLSASRLSSIILWGPPGVGKTTIARLIAKQTDCDFEQLSAIFSGVADLRKVFDRAKARRETGRGTILFVDEVHRFNKAQQDSFLPHVEAGLITLIGATTENPSFELTPALLSRAQVMVLKRLDTEALEKLLVRAEKQEGRKAPLDHGARQALLAMADGDGRFLLNLVEDIFLEPDGGDDLSTEQLAQIVQRRAPNYDKSDEGHYNLASALQKSIRGSDVDAALYWAARMLAGGEDPKFILRRLIVIASEDIGNADPQALPLAVAAKGAYEFLGQPEGEIAIGQLVAYLGAAPKSNRSHTAFIQAKIAAKETGSLAPPMHAMNAPTKLMKSLGYADGYIYDHNTEDGFAGLNYFPPEMERQRFYTPSSSGYDQEISRRLEHWASLRQKKQSQREE
ncbi:MAG: replication-associated recombination protein A [Pseudomonadota bacterium]